MHRMREEGLHPQRLFRGLERYPSFIVPNRANLKIITPKLEIVAASGTPVLVMMLHRRYIIVDGVHRLMYPRSQLSPTWSSINQKRAQGTGTSTPYEHQHRQRWQWYANSYCSTRPPLHSSYKPSSSTYTRSHWPHHR